MMTATSTSTSSPSAAPAAASSSSSADEKVVSDGWDPARNQDEAIKAQEQAIEREIADRNSLIGDKIPLDILLEEYGQEDHVYRSKIHDLKSLYGTMRKSRPDGNCFFRAFGFSLFHSLLNDDQEIDRMIDVAHNVHQDLHQQGFSFTVDDFHEVFQECLQELRSHQVTTSQQLLSSIFNDNARSDYIVVFLRLITSSHLQKNAEFFQAFIEDGLSVKEFCSHEVEPMYKESDHIHVIAITTATRVAVRINYLDRGGTIDKVNVHDFPEGVVNPQIHLLYRPGHYDVLYPHASCPSHRSNNGNNTPHDNVTSSSPPTTAAGIESSDSCINPVSGSHQQQEQQQQANGSSSGNGGGESSDQYQDQSDAIGSNSNHNHSSSRHAHVTSSSTSSSPTTSPNNAASEMDSSSHHHDQHNNNSSSSSSSSGGSEEAGVSSSKNPRLDPGVSSSESDSNEPASTTTTE